MRKILFRGKRVGNGEWVEGHLSTPLTINIVSMESEKEVIFTPVEVIPESVGQYIVLEDNERIFEKDIIQEWKHDSLLRTFIAKDIRTFTREYDRSEHDSVYKVIGNTYDNPELTEDKS